MFCVESLKIMNGRAYRVKLNVSHVLLQTLREDTILARV